MTSNPPTHDNAYKNLFSHPDMVRDLLRGYVEEEWVKELDYATLEVCSGNHVTDSMTDREDDIIWRIRYRNQWIYIYLLIEFQSTVDPWMALRTMVYTGLLYQDLIKQKRVNAGEALPPVFPIVVYNGEPVWTAARNINELIQKVPGGLQTYIPSLRYHLLDEGRTRKRLPGNRMSDIINLETGPNPEYLQQLVNHLTHHLKGPENRELRRAFAVWINRIALKRLAPGTILPEVNELNEVQNMLAERVTQWTENWKQEGMQKGIPMGQQKEAARMIYRLLTRRFGILSIETRQKLENAPTEQLEQWGENLMDAKTLEEVFL